MSETFHFSSRDLLIFRAQLIKIVKNSTLNTYTFTRRASLFSVIIAQKYDKFREPVSNVLGGCAKLNTNMYIKVNGSQTLV